MVDNPLISILIVNYNGKTFLDECFSSIKEHCSFRAEIIVVDNASSDGSAEYILKHHPDVQVIQNKENAGFSRGNNIAAKHAHGKYLLLLNNDTKLLSDLGPAILTMERNDRIGALGVKMLGRKEEYRFSAGHFPTPLKLLKYSNLYRKDGSFLKGTFLTKDVVPVDWVEGSFLITRSELWDRLGGLDEEYFMYGEDIDFCYRVKAVGMEVQYFPGIAFMHYGGYGSNRNGMLVRGLRRFHTKHSKPLQKISANFILTFGLLVRIVVWPIYVLLGRKSAKDRLSASWQAFRQSPW
jgi:N-acetylglucosaminyl-diphospho-decaprenol L-rhamnosyltransferase